MVVRVKIHGILADFVRTQEVIQDRQARKGEYDGIPELPKIEKKKKQKRTK